MKVCKICGTKIAATEHLILWAISLGKEAKCSTCVNLPKHIKIYDICMAKAELAETLWDKTSWIHLADAVEKGSISPLEAYDTINLGYVTYHLEVRESRYSHLL